MNFAYVERSKRATPFACGAHLLGDGPNHDGSIEVVDPQRLGPSARLEPGGALPAGGFADGGTGCSLLRQQRRAAHAHVRTRAAGAGQCIAYSRPSGFRASCRAATRGCSPSDPMRATSTSVRSIVGWPSTIHSASASPTPGPEDDPLRVQARRHEQVPAPRGTRPSMEVRVGREALGRAQEVLEPERLAAPGSRSRACAEHRREVIPVRAELGEPAGRDVAGRLRLALRLERRRSAIRRGSART